MTHTPLCASVPLHFFIPLRLTEIVYSVTVFDRNWKMSESNDDFYLRYYVGHKGKFGHEFLEFEFRPDGKLRYANNSNYKKDTLIRKEVFVNRAVIEELKRIVNESDIMKEDDAIWSVPLSFCHLSGRIVFPFF